MSVCLEQNQKAGSTGLATVGRTSLSSQRCCFAAMSWPRNDDDWHIGLVAMFPHKVPVLCSQKYCRPCLYLMIWHAFHPGIPVKSQIYGGSQTALIDIK